MRPSLLSFPAKTAGAKVLFKSKVSTQEKKMSAKTCFFVGNTQHINAFLTPGSPAQRLCFCFWCGEIGAARPSHHIHPLT
jgi:hypothetical protein